MAKVDKRTEIVKDVIFKTFSFLEDQGYIPDFKIEESNVFDESMVVVYCNEKNKREIRINYYEGKVDDETNYTFTVSITKKPYLSINDHFSLDLYLSSIGKNDIHFSLDKFDKEEVEFSLQAIAGSLKMEASKIIKGNEWLEGYYPRWS